MQPAILRGATMLNLVILTASMVTPTPPRLLVAGGTGFVGREICRDAVNRGWDAESAGTSSFFIIAPIVSVTTMLWRATMALGRKRS